MKALESELIFTISEFRKTPIIASSKKSITVLKDGKPAFYCLNPSRYEQLLSIEKKFNESKCEVNNA